MIDWFSDPAHWTGDGGVIALVIQHLVYSAAALLLACLIGLPVGLYVGHTGRGVVFIAGLANALRSLPSLGLIVLLVILFGPVFSSDMAFIVPSLIVLVLLAVPPIMTGSYAGIAAVDPAVVDAARGMGKRPLDILFDVELPCALPLIFPACAVQRFRSSQPQRLPLMSPLAAWGVLLSMAGPSTIITRWRQAPFLSVRLR